MVVKVMIMGMKEQAEVINKLRSIVAAISRENGQTFCEVDHFRNTIVMTCLQMMSAVNKTLM
jgi:hypothetical protein